jgi:hypothetical protein
MSHTRGPVAVWFLERDDQPAMDYDETVLAQVAELTAEAARVLRAHELLVAPRLVLTNWVDAGDGAVDADPVEVRLDTTERLAEVVLADARRRGRLSMRLELSGQSLLFDAAGRGSMVPGAVALHGFAFTVVAAEISTYVDAWLPYDLGAAAQPEVHERNAPRLAAALEELAALPGVSTSDLGPSRYAMVAGFELDNLRDLDGVPLPVIDD